MSSYYECYFDHEDDQGSRICDYFRKPVYRRSADV